MTGSAEAIERTHKLVDGATHDVRVTRVVGASPDGYLVYGGPAELRVQRAGFGKNADVTRVILVTTADRDWLVASEDHALITPDGGTLAFVIEDDYLLEVLDA